MGEDALAYVDRESHQYNGLTKEGMPPYLVGGDYVKTFICDRITHDIQIRVKLAVPARLYILLDDRLAPAQWLRDNFRDTGDNIGIERGPYFSGGRWENAETPADVGPGVGVDDTLSVWVRDVPKARVVVLGPTRASSKNNNMYGIIAVPLEETN